MESNRPAVRHAAEEQLYHAAHKPGMMYDFVTVLSAMATIPREYEPGLTLTMTEASTVAEIAVHPGVTAAQLCKKWSRTRGALSQLLKKLEQKGFICRVRAEGNDRALLLYPTVKGMDLNARMERVEKRYHRQMLEELQARGCTKADMDAFYRVTACYTDVLRARADLQWDNLVPQYGRKENSPAPD